MATDIKGATIASSYDRLVLIEDGTDIGSGTSTVNLEIQRQNGDATATPLHISTTRLGIGASSPDQQLHIYGGNAQILIQESATEFVRIGIDDSAEEMIIGWDDSDAMHFGVFTTTTHNVMNKHMTIAADGKVGIGQSTPTSLLHLGTSTEELEIVDAGSTSATEQDWIKVEVGGNAGYIRVYATK